MKETSIRERRIKNKFSPEYVMDKLEISKSTFYKLEEGYQTPSAKLVIKFAKLYKCTTDEIFKDFGMD